jgi:hypothetical protein
MFTPHSSKELESPKVGFEQWVLRFKMKIKNIWAENSIFAAIFLQLLQERKTKHHFLCSWRPLNEWHCRNIYWNDHQTYQDNITSCNSQMTG